METIYKMKLIQFNGFKTLAMIVILLVLLIYYHNFFKSFGYFDQRLNGTETTKTDYLLTESEMTTSKRIKRFLIFQGGGIVKLVFGTSFPIMLSGKKRSLNYFYNFQMQYAPPTIPLYWWSFINTTTFAARTKLYKRAMDKLPHYDKSRNLIYKFMETILERSGNKGSKCILKIICELSRAPLIDDLRSSEDHTMHQSTKNKDKDNKSGEDYGRNIYHKLINAIFIPMYSNVDERYVNARVSGQNGANCNETFGECPVIDKWLQQFTQLF